MDNLTQKLINIPKFGSGVGLHRMNILCKDVLASDWATKVDPINVVGTNGKGSTTVIISHILRALELNVGQYISPHLFEFSERISINNKKITQTDLAKIFDEVHLKKNKITEELQEEVGAFEVFTSIALSYFLEKKPDTVILEAGIGGRHDSTRVFTGNFVAFTSVELEHTNVLGATEELIAFDKIDMANEGATVILGDVSAHILQKLQNYATEKGIRICPIKEHTSIQNISYDDDRMIVDITVDDYEFKELTSNLIGDHQVSNILVAILLTKKWLEKNYPTIGKETFMTAVYQALPNIHWKGRLEKIHTNPTIQIDVGHTIAAVTSLVNTYTKLKKKPCILITGVSYDKEVESIVRILTTVADAVVCTRAYHKGAEVDKIAKTVTGIYPNKDAVFKFETIEESIDFSKSYAKQHDMEILIAGGLFLSIEAYHYINGNIPSNLHFF
ncbi:Mur ligase family protein [uncultured Kordia sp.]|uniref:bifunctional folylpolyglutamate synthase/dihydrofolate synthase n=1 Tax=uncultured Kordia sp. TaxID=507699 RepID=UPI0026295D0E|nr:Mur ligase family protein [uncultured Kordia sp.]